MTLRCSKRTSWTAGKAEGTESSPRSVQLFHLHCTLVWLFFRKTHASIFTTPHLWLWLVGTTVQMMPRLHRITECVKSANTQTLPYPRYWNGGWSPRLIGNCWKSRGYRTALLLWGTHRSLFLQCQCYCQFWKSFNTVYIQVSKIFTGQTDRLTDWQTDRLTDR